MVYSIEMVDGSTGERKLFTNKKRGDIFLRIKYVIVIVIGVILMIMSAKPLFLMGQEMVYQSRVKQNIKVDRIYVNFLELDKVEILGRGAPIPVENISIKNYLYDGNVSQLIKSSQEYNSIVQKSNISSIRYARDYFWEGNTIRIEDTFHPGNFNEDSREKSSIGITINDKDWSVIHPVEVRPNYLDENRYHGYFGLLIVEEKGNENLILVQRLLGNQEADLVWRTLTIKNNGQVLENQFSYEHRSDVPQRVDYINLSNTSPFSLGYKSNILQGWPSLFFPLLYPFVTASLGLLLIVIGSLSTFIGLKKKRRLLKR